MANWMCLLSLLLLVFGDDDILLKPTSTSGHPAAFIVIGRRDVSNQAYVALSQQIQTSMLPDVSLFVNIRSSVDNVQDTLTQLANDYNVHDVYFVGHSMDDGGVAVQEYVRKQPDQAKAVILLSAFLTRTQRPDIRECLTKAQYQPKISLTHPLGYLEDGVHDCYGPNVIDFPVPTLTLSGDLDGVVRVTRIAEAYYTQNVLVDRAEEHPVLVLEGVNHAVLLELSSVPPSIASRDLRAELDVESARKQVALSIRAFLLAQPSLKEQQGRAAAFFAPLITAFVQLEGSWFFTGGDEEHGASPWSAQAQVLMASPLPAGTEYRWVTSNENRLVTDEDKIPPYYRPKHRANVQVQGSEITASTVAQPRYLEFTPFEAGYGLNGDTIIKEEKLNILTALNDTGFHYVSCIELATKLASRQLVYNLTGNESPDSLDDGDRCKDINTQAYDKARALLSDVARVRFDKYGKPLVMGPDLKPSPPAGPWWIFNYLQYQDHSDSQQLASYYAFYGLDANPYGAGNHYCKLLSPARALEWLLVDGLRAHYHV